ncbi:hypothetical protein BWK69_00020 [Candidatus Parcubacteria bacterium A4]|nr:MAG: hypothetical protein BWK69_00020 [Candidatus Parcubacteria bacterium A4]
MNLIFSQFTAVKNSVRPSEDATERGCGGEFRRTRAKAKPRRPARSEQSPAKKFSFPFRRKRNRAQNKKLRRKLFCGVAIRQLAESGGRAERQSSQSGFSSKNVRISSNKLHHIDINSPPKCIIFLSELVWT